MSDNQKSELPDMPTLEEVRAAMKETGETSPTIAAAVEAEDKARQSSQTAEEY